jgi:hypothetical protein
MRYSYLTNDETKEAMQPILKFAYVLLLRSKQNQGLLASMISSEPAFQLYDFVLKPFGPT